MATRVTPLSLAACIALVAMGPLAGSVSACGDNQAKAARASAACCATKARTTTACATPTAKASVTAACATPAAKATATTASATPTAKPAAKLPASAARMSLPGAIAPAATTAFPSLPKFTPPAPVVAGLMAYIDPESGLLCGPIGDLRVPDDVTRMFAAPVELTPVTLPNGAVMLDLQGTLQDFYVLTIDPLGRRSIRCVQDARHAQAPATPIVLPIAER